MTVDGSEPEVSPGIGAEISEGLKLLASSSPEDVADEAVAQLVELSASELRRQRSTVPLPPLARQVDRAERRAVSSDADAIAERILVAAGGGSVRIDLAAPPAPPPSPPAMSDDPDRTVARQPGDSTHTLAPTQATVRAVSGDDYLLAEGDELVVGRSPGVGGLLVDHSEVSRRHVQLQLRLGQLVATDLGSVNGTTVVGEEVTNLRPTSAHRLSPGDRLVVNGDIELLTVVAIGAAP